MRVSELADAVVGLGQFLALVWRLLLRDSLSGPRQDALIVCDHFFESQYLLVGGSGEWADLPFLQRVAKLVELVCIHSGFFFSRDA
jgi:hypothetical protein